MYMQYWSKWFNHHCEVSSFRTATIARTKIFLMDLFCSFVEHLFLSNNMHTSPSLTSFFLLINSSAQIFNGVGFPHPVPLNFLEDLPKPTRDEAIQFLGRLCSCLAFVVNAIQR